MDEGGAASGTRVRSDHVPIQDTEDRRYLQVEALSTGNVLYPSIVGERPETYGAPRAFRLGWTSFILILTVLPYFIAYRLTPTGYVYAWIFPPFSPDSQAYMAWSRQAYNGHILFSLKFTAFPHSPFIFNPFFLVCGWLARLSGLDLAIVHLLVKSIGVVFFFQVFFKFLEYFRFSRSESLIAAILVGVSAGFGGLLKTMLGDRAVDIIKPADLLLIDSNTFWSLLWNPLFPYSLALILLAVQFMDKAASGDDKRSAWLCGFVVGLLALIHPYQIALIVPLLVGIGVVRKGKNAGPIFIRFAASSIPFILYPACVSLFNEAARRHGALGQMASPPLIGVFFGFGLPLVAASLGFCFYGRMFLKRYWIFILWIVLALLLSYSPLWFRGKLLFGVQIPICVLAAAAVGHWFSEIKGKTARKAALGGAAVVLLPLATFSQAALFRYGFQVLDRNPSSDYWIKQDVWDGLEFLRKNTSPDDLVFSGVVTSAKVATYSGNTVLWGHWAQTVDPVERAGWFRRVFDPASGLSDRDRGREFWGLGIRYLFLDGIDKKSFQKSAPSWLAAGTEKIFENSSVVIYRRRAGDESVS